MGDRDVDEFLNTFRRVWELAQRGPAEGNSLVDRMTAHLGADPATLAVFSEEFENFDHPNLQVALNERLGRPGVEANLLGVAIENKRFMGASLSDLIARSAAQIGPRLSEGPVDYVNFHLADDEVLACVQYGLYLVREASASFAVFVAGPSVGGGPRAKLRIEVMGRDAAGSQKLLGEITALMSERNVYRGHVVSIGVAQVQFGPAPQTLVQFHRRPQVPRDAVVLPEAILARIERQAIGVSEHAAELVSAGRALKRGMLLHGLPGTGKTLTVMYLSGRLADRTVILTTGRSMGMVTAIAQLARVLAPAMLVLEDVDLIAEERGNPFQRSNPVLFELLNEMDGLREDADVLYVLTTNRADVLEPALAARPGRVDHVAELPVPDAAGRRRLLELYGRGLEFDGVDLDQLAVRTDGATPAYIKELLRKAAVVAAEAGHSPRVAGADVDAAIDELAEGGRLAERLVGFRPDSVEMRVPPPGGGPPAAGWRASGFPGGGN